jgi:hypothetical protein
MSRIETIVVLGFLAGAATFGQTIGSPSRLEVNLGPFPFDRYSQSNSSGYIPNCAAPTVRACYQQALSGYAAQGVKSVRFLFALRGGGDSTAMDSSGNLVAQWENNVKLFMGDVKAAGIEAVVPSPHLFSWQNDGEFYWRVCAPSAQTPSAPVLTDQQILNAGHTLNPPPTCTGFDVNVTLRFWPTSPFGAWPTYTNGNPTNPEFGNAEMYYTNEDAYNFARRTRASSAGRTSWTPSAR